MKNIFISSTFRDMQAERDLVQEKVLPALREEAKKYGDNVGVIDLRWGVDTSTLETDEGSAKVLKVCLDEIDRSHPYMLIFLGERYGWIPNGNLIERAVRERRDKYFTDDFEKSVTALEIEYGALSEQYGDLNRCIVCFREPVAAGMNDENEAIYAEQNEKGRRKLEELKERIRQKLGDENRLISYTCKWDESAQVLKDFTSNGQPLEDVLVKRYIEMFEKDWEAYQNLSWQEKEQLGFRALMESKLRTFVGREALLEEYYEKIINSTQPLILQGEVGSGKTAIMCKLIDRMQKEGKKVFPFFCGMGSMSKNANELVQQMIYFVETQIGAEHKVFDEENDIAESEKLHRQEVGNQKLSKYEQRLEYLRELVMRVQNRIYIYIDALDQLVDDEHVEKLDFLFHTEKIQMVASCTDTFELGVATKLRTQQEGIPLLTLEDTKLVAERILRVDSRDYFEELENAILSKKSIGSPLYISLLIQRLNMMDQGELAQINNAEEIATYSAKVIAKMPDTQAEAAVAILKNALGKITGKTEGILLEAVYLLAVSRQGLNIEDLKAIFTARGEEFPVLDMTMLMKYLNAFFYVGEEDRVNFTHKVIRAGILEEIKDRGIYENEIKKYIKALDQNELLYMQEGMYFARVTKDYEFAVKIILSCYEKESEILLNAITEEAICDEAEFFGQLLLKEKKNLFFVKWCLFEKVINRLDLSKKQMQVKVVLFQTLVRYNEDLYTKTQSDKHLRALLISYSHMGQVLSDLGNLEEALKYHEKEITCTETLYEHQRTDENLRELSMSYDFIGRVLHRLGRNEESVKYHEKAVKYAEELYENKKTDRNLRGLAIHYDYIGRVLQDLGQIEEALVYQKKCLEYNERLYEKNPSIKALRELAICYGNIGTLLGKMDNEEAQMYFEKWIACCEQVYENRQDVTSLRALMWSYDSMGQLLLKLGQPEKAFIYLKKALRYAENLHENQQSKASLEALSVVYDDMGRVLRNMGKPEEAILYIEKGLNCSKEVYEKEPSYAGLRAVMVSYNHIGHVLRQMGKSQEAQEYYLIGVKYAEELYEKHPNIATLKELAIGYDNVGSALRNMGDEAKAIEFFIKSVDCFEQVYEKQKFKQNKEDFIWICEKVSNLAHKLAYEHNVKGEIEEALSYYIKTLEYDQKIYAKEQSDEKLRDICVTRINITGIWLRLNKAENVIETCDHAVQGLKTLYEKEKTASAGYDLANGYYYKVKILMELKRFEDALECGLFAQPISKTAYLEDANAAYGRLYIHIMRLCAECFTKIGKLEEARSYQAAAIKEAEILYERTADSKTKELIDELKSSKNS